MILLDLIAEIVGALVPTSGAKSTLAKHNRELRAQGRAEIAVRLLTGTVAGLGPTFRGGSWSVRAGAISLGPITVPVESVSPSHRSPTFREEFRVFQTSCVYAAAGAGVTFEIAIQECDVDWVISVLGGIRREELTT